MSHTTIKDIVSHKILNETTGELENKDFIEIRERKKIRGGFRMAYKNYDDAVEEVISSKLDYKILVYIRDSFTYQRVETPLPKDVISKSLDVSAQKVTLIIKKMLEAGLLYRVSRGVYRMNPFMYVPFRANAADLQSEWEFITNKKN